MWRLTWSGLFIIGILLVLFGISVDYLLPWTSPGVNPLQLLVIAAGLAMLILAALLRGRRSRPGNSGRLGRSWELILASALVTIFALEIALVARGVPVYYPADPANTALRERPWWTCGAAGCHYVYDEVQAACATGELKDRVCAVNRQGYAGSEDFILSADWQERTRILLLGDSFTWGMRAELGSSYAETLENALPQAIIWNTGMPGAGTNQALMVFETYAPLLRPQLTILGFYQNDFDDNLLPIDSWLNALDGNGQTFHVRRYAIDEEENVTELDLYTLGFIRANGRHPPSSELERQLGMTRLGTLLLRLRDMAASPAPEAAPYERRRQVTKQYLLDLKRAVSSSGSELLVILIPYSEDIEDTQGLRPRFRIAKELMRELSIPYLNPISILDPVADYGLPLDSHWTNTGHQKVGELLSDCVRRYLASGGFSDCAHITLP